MNLSEWKNSVPPCKSTLKLPHKKLKGKIQQSKCMQIIMKKLQKIEKVNCRLKDLCNWQNNQNQRADMDCKHKVKKLSNMQNLKTKRSLNRKNSSIHNILKCWRKYSKKIMTKNRGSEKKRLRRNKWNCRGSTNKIKSRWTSYFKKESLKLNRKQSVNLRKSNNKRKRCFSISRKTTKKESDELSW